MMSANKIVSICIIGGTTLAGALLYKYFISGNPLSKLKYEYQKNNNCLSKDLALRIMIHGIVKGDEHYRKKHSDLENKRREKLEGDGDGYDELCQETLNTKQECYDEEFLKIIESFQGKFSMNELLEISGGLPAMQLSHLLYNYEIPYYEGRLPTVDKAVEVYEFYCDYISKGLSETKITQSDDIYEQKDLYFKMYYLNLKVNDVIFQKHGLNDQIAKYVLKKNNMFENAKIKKLTKKIAPFEKILLSY